MAQLVSQPFRCKSLPAGGISLVAAYRLYHIDGGGRFSAAEWIEAVDDEAAVAAARALNKSIACELWQGQRFVGRVESEQSGGGA